MREILPPYTDEGPIQHKLAAIDPSYPALVASPIRCPMFRRAQGGWEPDWTTLPD
jgi:hypothetical protein